MQGTFCSLTAISQANMHLSLEIQIKKNEIQSPLQRLWRKKVASILLQTHNCTLYPSNSYDGREGGKSACQTKLSWYVNFSGCNMCAFADNHFLPRPQTCTLLDICTVHVCAFEFNKLYKNKTLLSDSKACKIVKWNFRWFVWISFHGILKI